MGNTENPTPLSTLVSPVDTPPADVQAAMEASPPAAAYNLVMESTIALLNKGGAQLLLYPTGLIGVHAELDHRSENSESTTAPAGVIDAVFRPQTNTPTPEDPYNSFTIRAIPPTTTGKAIRLSGSNHTVTLSTYELLSPDDQLAFITTPEFDTPEIQQRAATIEYGAPESKSELERLADLLQTLTINRDRTEQAAHRMAEANNLTIINSADAPAPPAS